jgi:hypothetical protein
MGFVRGNIAGQNTITDHEEASILGRKIGLATIDGVCCDGSFLEI